MKKILFPFLFCFLVLKSTAINDKFKLGILASPGMSWLTPLDTDLKKGKVKYGMNYGIQFEYYFTSENNYAIATGLFGGMEGGQVSGRDTFAFFAGGKTVSENYFMHNFQIPIAVKLKTNNLKNTNFRVFGQLGFANVFTVSSRATFDNTMYKATVPYTITRENVLSTKNDVTNFIPGFKYNFYDIRLDVSAGAEYEIDDKTSIVFGIQFQNGFLNQLADKDKKNEPMHMRLFNFRVGVMF